MKYFRYIFLLLLFCLCVTSCSTTKKLIRQTEKERRYEKKIERKQLKWAYKAYKKEYRVWHKQQTPDVKKKLKVQHRETKKFYKPYGKACTNMAPGQYRPLPSKYRKDGIK